VSGGDHCWFKRSTGKKRPVTETSISYNNNNYNATLYSNRSVITDQTTYNNRPNTVTLHKTIKEAYSTAAASSNSHSLHSTVTQKLQKHKNLKVELARIIRRSIKYRSYYPQKVLFKTNYTKD